MLYNEAKIMEVLRHKNIVKFNEAADSLDTFQYVMEFIGGIDLFEYVENNPLIPEEQASYIMKELFETVKYIHQSGIVHWDLKPENIMVVLDKKKKWIQSIKIIDFGLSCYFSDLETNKDKLVRCGTINYSAPEVLDRT